MNILIIEDELHLQEALAASLKKKVIRPTALPMESAVLNLHSATAMTLFFLI